MSISPAAQQTGDITYGSVPHPPKPEKQKTRRLCTRGGQDSTSALCTTGLMHAEPGWKGTNSLQTQTWTTSLPLPGLLSRCPLCRVGVFQHWMLVRGSCVGTADGSTPPGSLRLLLLGCARAAQELLSHLSPAASRDEAFDLQG